MKGHSVQIAKDKLHIVAASKQALAKQRLSTNAFVKIDTQEATQLVGISTELSIGGNYYLVRASAFYVDQNYSIKSGLKGYLFPE